MDTFIYSTKKKITKKSLRIATLANNLVQFDYEGSSFLVEHYKVKINKFQ